MPKKRKNSSTASKKKSSQKKTADSDFTKLLKKLKYLIFDDESLMGWIAAFIFMFVLLKFLVMPVTGLILQTDYPVVAVVSGSMQHSLDGEGHVCGNRPMHYENDFDSWWNTCGKYYINNYNITKDNFSKYPQSNGFNIGDVMILYGTSSDNLERGDIIVFEGGRSKPIIHRIVDKQSKNDKYYFTTKGDHNPRTYKFETNISQEKVYGRAVFKIPFIGYIKILFFKLLEFFIGIF